MTALTRSITLGLLANRAMGATVCPSEVARTIAGTEDWRDLMPVVHATIDQLLGDGLIQLSWKGKLLIARTGPYRIGRPPAS